MTRPHRRPRPIVVAFSTLLLALAAVADARARTLACVPDNDTGCLIGGRFQVEVDYDLGAPPARLRS